MAGKGALRAVPTICPLANTLQAGPFRTSLRLRGNADSPSDGFRPSSAQYSTCRGDCAWTIENRQFRKALLLKIPTLTRRRSILSAKALQSFKVRQSFFFPLTGRSKPRKIPLLKKKDSGAKRNYFVTEFLAGCCFCSLVGPSSLVLYLS